MTPTPDPVWRCERKFPVQCADPGEIELCVRSLAPALREAFKPRWVNNIYFDSENLSSFWENQEGDPNRAKLRIRWYGQFIGPVAKPILELKIKQGNTGKKDRFPLPRFTMREKLNLQEIKKQKSRWELPRWLDEVLKEKTHLSTNSYFRKYFVLSGGRVRLTLDSQMKMGRISKRGWKPTASWKTLGRHVIEVKYDPKDEEEVMELTQGLPFRLDKFSKYVTGIHADSLY